MDAQQYALITGSKVIHGHVALTVVCVASGMPRTPTKTFPKKFDSALHGPKSTYTSFSKAPVVNMQPPAWLAGNLHQVSSYAGVGHVGEGAALVAPPVDSYSDPTGSVYVEIAPPPVDAVVPEGQESYTSFDGVGVAAIAPPSLSSYATLPEDAHEARILASLASMIRLLPPAPITSYDTYEPNPVASIALSPPSAQEQPRALTSSYSSYDMTPVEQEDMASLGVSTKLRPPPL